MNNRYPSDEYFNSRLSMPTDVLTGDEQKRGVELLTVLLVVIYVKHADIATIKLEHGALL